ncbi:MAG: response regulator transcription factor [Elusimicrobiota bacterium]
MIKILVADDHSLVRQAFIGLLCKVQGIKVVGEACDGDACIRAVLQSSPDVVLMDIDMPKTNGIEVTRHIFENKQLKKCPEVIMLTMYSDTAHIFDSVKAGAMGYVPKDCELPDLVEIIKSVNSGRFVLHHSLSDNFIETIKTLPFESGFNLTAKEIELVGCISKGLSNKQIAIKLALSERTVKNRLNVIFKKLNVSNRAHVVNEAIKRGIISSS